MSLICAAHVSMGPHGHDQPTRDLTLKENQLSLPESHPCQSFPTCGWVGAYDPLSLHARRLIGLLHCRSGLAAVATMS